MSKLVQELKMSLVGKIVQEPKNVGQQEKIEHRMQEKLNIE